MKIKVRGGTLPGGKSLCFSCNHSDVIRGQNGQEIILCKALSWDRKRITFPVAECTMFHSGGSISLSSLKEIAWIVQARPRGPKGFEPSKDNIEITISPPPPKDSEKETLVKLRQPTSERPCMIEGGDD
jgi:hypothetical protein